MSWNWQEPDWPNFRFQADRLGPQEAAFLRQSGVVVGTVRHLPDDERLLLVIDLIST
jgi:Fic family protein